jgi:hypothetical protein
MNNKALTSTIDYSSQCESRAIRFAYGKILIINVPVPHTRELECGELDFSVRSELCVTPLAATLVVPVPFQCMPVSLCRRHCLTLPLLG